MQEGQEDTTIQLKQDIIKMEIIDKHYDTQKFLSYCLSKKENGDNLINWTLDELKDIIALFAKEQNGSSIIGRSDMPQSTKYQAHIDVDIDKLRIMVRTVM